MEHGEQFVRITGAYRMLMWFVANWDDGALSALRDVAFGQGTGPIWLNRVHCGARGYQDISLAMHARREFFNFYDLA